jgi:hypothetical protein
VTIFCPTFPEHETGAPEASDARALVASKAPDTRARVASVDREIFLGDGGIPPRKIERDHGDQGEASAVPAGDPSAIQASLVAMKAAPVSEGAAPHNRARAGPPRDWATYRDARFAFSLSYPRDVFTGELTPLDDHRRIFLSDDGRAQLVVMARVRTRETIASHRQSIINERYADARFDYTPIRDTWFVLSGTRGGDIFYEHSAFACGGHALLGWQLTYRIAEREFYDRIVQEINHKFRYRGGNESCG